MLSVDRIENGIAVAVDDSGSVTDIPPDMIAGDVHEGDILVFDGEKYHTDTRAAELRKMYIRELEKDLWE